MHGIPLLCREGSGQWVRGRWWQYTVGRETCSSPESLPTLEEQASTEPPRRD